MKIDVHNHVLPHSAVEKFQRTPLAQYFEHALTLLGQTVLPFAHATPLLVVAWSLVSTSACLLARRDRVMRMLVLYALTLRRALVDVGSKARRTEGVDASPGGHDPRIAPTPLI